MKTFSKAWGLSGIRLGYMVADKKLSQYISNAGLWLKQIH